MYGRGGGLWIVLLSAVAVGIIAGSGAAAAVLTAEEMGAVKGGCSSTWCKNVDCAAGWDSGCWELHGNCYPGFPYMACDNSIVHPETRSSCVSSTNTGAPCTPQVYRSCGPIYECVCTYFGPLYECESRLTGVHAGLYYPGCP